MMGLDLTYLGTDIGISMQNEQAQSRTSMHTTSIQAQTCKHTQARTGRQALAWMHMQAGTTSRQEHACRHKHASTHRQEQADGHLHTGTSRRAQAGRNRHGGTSIYTQAGRHKHLGTSMQARTSRHKQECWTTWCLCLLHMLASLRERVLNPGRSRASPGSPRAKFPVPANPGRDRSQHIDN